jgi:uncharacterized protein involved in exopolysaccharide biosynthesis
MQQNHVALHGEHDAVQHPAVEKGGEVQMTSEQGYARIRGVLRRRKLWVVAVATVVLAGAALTIGELRPVYKAGAVLRVLESQPHKDYVAPTVAEQVGERLKTLRLAVMARPILEQVTDELRLAEAFHQGREQAIDDLRLRMEVKVEGDDTFLLTYEDGDAVRARAVVNAVADRFMRDQVERREQVATAVEKSLADEVARLRPELDRLEGTVRDFKLAHYGSLPEQQEANLRTLDQTAMELNIQSTNLDISEERRRQLLLGSMSTMRHNEQLLAAELHEALTKYTPEHPEVQRIQAEFDKVHDERVADERRLRSSASTEPEIVALGGEIQRERALLSGLRKRQEEVRARLDDTAKNGQSLAQLTTDLDAVRAKYTAAIGKLHDAQLASGVERNLRAMRYELVEGAAQPIHPIRPNRPLLALGALVLAGLLGLGAGFARDFSDGSIHSPDELALLDPGRGGVDVLACVPSLSTDEGGAARR